MLTTRGIIEETEFEALLKTGLHAVATDSEYGFDWYACECCGDRHGGSRYGVAIIQPGIGMHSEYKACVDCYNQYV